MKNKVTVVPADNLIIVDGEVLYFDFEVSADIHAMQWKEDKGWVEYTDKRSNKPADYNTDIAPFVALWEAEKARLEEEANKPLSPEEIKTIKLEELKNANIYAEEHGYIQLENGIKVDGRRSDLTNIQGLISMTNKGVITLPIEFKDYDNNFQTISLEDLQQMETLIEIRGTLLYAKKWELENQINIAETTEDIININVYINWPGIDGEARA